MNSNSISIVYYLYHLRQVTLSLGYFLCQRKGNEYNGEVLSLESWL
jgi:hypothetical protein